MRTTDRARVFLIFLFVAVLCLPLAKRVFRLWPEAPLGGVVTWVSPVPFLWSNWSDRTFQQYFESPRTYFFGEMAYGIRANRTLDFFVFGQIPDLVVGKDNTLFDPSYLDGALRSPTLEPWIEAHAAQIRSVAAFLKGKGVRLLYLIAPSKVEVYSDRLPEPLPSDLKRALTSQTVRPHLRLAQKLKADGVPVLDASELLRRWRQEDPRTPYFTRAGIHWGHYAHCRVMGELIKKLSEMVPIGEGSTSCARGSDDEVARGTDGDLADMANLHFPGILLRGTPGGTLLKEGKFTYRDGVSVIGDSFSNFTVDGLSEVFPESRVSRFYYYKTLFETPNSPFVTLTNKTPEERIAKVLRNRLVILVFNESRFGAPSYQDLFLSDVEALASQSGDRSLTQSPDGR